MRSQAVAVSVALLGLCCLLIPRGGESAGGIISLSGNTLQDQSPDEPETESLGLAVDLVGRSTKHRRSTEEAVQEGKQWKFVFQLLNIQTGRQGLLSLSSIKDVRATFEINPQPFSLTALGLCDCVYVLTCWLLHKGINRKDTIVWLTPKWRQRRVKHLASRLTFFSTDSGLPMINVDCGAQSHGHD